MHCHLLIPGLLPADQNFRATLEGLALPALSQLLGKGQRSMQPGIALEDWLGQRFQLNAAAVAPLRLLGEGETEVCHDQDWLCADPAQLRVTSQGMMLADASTLDIRQEEADALIADLNREFADLGHFHAGTPGHWYLRPVQPVQATLHPLSQTIGRRVDAYLPQGEDAPLWRRYFNEIQVFLHHHPVNLARENAGRPVINSVWFWGNGKLPAKPSHLPYGTVIADDAMARGIARWCALPCLPETSTCHAPDMAQPVLSILSALTRHSLYEEHEAWLTTLVEMDKNHLAPALSALKTGRLHALTLTAPGDHATLEVQLKRSDLWKFWRGPLALKQLATADY